MKYYGPQISTHLKDFLLKRYSDVIVFAYTKDEHDHEFARAFIANTVKIAIACVKQGDVIAFYESPLSNQRDVEELLDQPPVYKTNINNIQNMYYVC
jgi:hypothetical protein